MDRHDDLNRQREIVRPRFDDFDMSESSLAWYQHSLVPRGGIAAVACVANGVFLKIALVAFDLSSGLSESGKVFVSSAMGVCALLVTGYAIRSFREVVQHAETEKSRNRAPQSRNRSRRPGTY